MEIVSSEHVIRTLVIGLVINEDITNISMKERNHI